MKMEKKLDLKSGIEKRKKGTVLRNGKKEEKKEMAKKMLEKKYDIDTIMELTELTREEIEKIK